jgi:zinc protease
MALRIFPGLLYGRGHPYGNPMTGSGTTESIEKMTREDLAKFHQTWFRPNNAAIVVVGDTTLAEIAPKLEGLLAGWKQGDVPKKEIRNVSLPSKSIVYLIDKPGAPQSVIIVGNVATPKASPEAIAIQAMNDGLGGMFSSRLNLNLREDKHWSYGASSSLVDAKGQRPFTAVVSVQSDKTKESMAEILREFRGIVGEDPLTAKDLKYIQSYELLALPGSRETLNAVGKSIIDLVQFGLPDDYYETYARKVRSLDTNDVHNAAKIVIHPDRLIWVVVGDRAKIEREVNKLGLGELRFLSPNGKRL